MTTVDAKKRATYTGYTSEVACFLVQRGGVCSLQFSINKTGPIMSSLLILITSEIIEEEECALHYSLLQDVISPLGWI